MWKCLLIIDISEWLLFGLICGRTSVMGDDQRSHTWLEPRRVLSLLECAPVAILKFFIIIFEYRAQHFHLALGPPVT